MTILPFEPSPESPESRLQRFFDWFRSETPFDQPIARQPAPTDSVIDVEQIHQAEYRKLVGLADSVLRNRRGTGAVLWAERGVGKSHLLSRLWRWTGADRHACFLYLHDLLVRPDRLPRYALQCVVSMLSSGPPHRSPLYDLIRVFVRSALNVAGYSAAVYQVAEVERAYDAFVDRLAAHDPGRQILIDRSVYTVLFRFFVSANLAGHTSRDDGIARLAVRWLGGEALDATAAEKLSLPPPAAGEACTLADDEAVKQVFLALTELAWYRDQPFILCFDQQFENSSPEQVVTLSRFLHALIDSARNLLVIVAGSQQALIRLVNEGLITAPAWDRLAGSKIDLGLIRPPEARAILEVRLRHALAPFLDVPEIKACHDADPLFPLGSQWFKERTTAVIEVRPRDVLGWGRERWDRQQHRLETLTSSEWLRDWNKLDEAPPPPPPPFTQEAENRQIDEELGRRLDEAKTWRRREAATLPPNSDNLVRLLSSVLTYCADLPAYHDLTITPVGPASPTAPVYDFELSQPSPHGGTVRTGVLVIVNGNATSTTGKLRGLVEDEAPPDWVVLVTDARQPLALGVSAEAKGRIHLRSLEARGPGRFRHYVLNFEEYVALDALRHLAIEAATSQLDVTLPNGRTRDLTLAEVLGSFHRAGRLTELQLLRFLLEVGAVTEPDKRVEAFVRERGATVRSILMAQLALGSPQPGSTLVESCLREVRQLDRVEIDDEVGRDGVEAIARDLHDRGKIEMTSNADGTWTIARLVGRER